MEYKVFCTLIITLILGLSMVTQGDPDACNVAPKSRQNCGWPGVTEKECQARNCCFDDSVLDAPWCFSPQVEEEECFF